MKKALVTGCVRFNGSHFTEKLLKENWNVLGLDNFHAYYDKKLKVDNLNCFLNYENFQFFEGSILCENDIAINDYEIIKSICVKIYFAITYLIDQRTIYLSNTKQVF